MDDNGSVESLVSGAGIAIAATVLMITALALFRSTGPANDSISLQSVASGVSGDIGTVAISAVACYYDRAYSAGGMTIRVTSDYVIVGDAAGKEFARPLPVRVYPGTYSAAGRVLWNDTSGLKEYLNATFGSPGTEEFPLNQTAGSEVTALMENARLDMAGHPLTVSATGPLTIEKTFLFTYNDSSQTTESEPYVFVFQR